MSDNEILVKKYRILTFRIENALNASGIPRNDPEWGVVWQTLEWIYAVEAEYAQERLKAESKSGISQQDSSYHDHSRD
jgi:hypothetical protein